MSRILRVNMTDLTVGYEDVPEKYRLLGGRGLTSAITADEVPPTCHPLGPSNKLTFAPGLLTGSSAPSSGRLSAGGKSPLTGTIKESNAGGLAGQKLAKLGIKAVVVEGHPQKADFYLLRIDKDGATLRPAGDLVGKGMYEVADLLWQEYGKVGIIGIGPAGEMKLANAGISVNDMENGPGRYAGRGGLGAVMGAKGLKAVVIDDKGGPGVPVLDPEEFKKQAKLMTEALLEHGVTGTTLPTYGTAALINVMNEAGGLPTRNFSSGRFEGAAKVSGERINELATKERKGVGKVGHACHPGCVIRCSNIFPKPDGTYHVACLEYESDWALGPNLGIDDIDAIAELNRICNDVGLDTIEAGVTLGVAMEAGVVPFGDGPGAIKLLQEVGKGSPLGRLIGSGSQVVGKTFGVVRIPTVKGQGMPAYDPRAVKGIGVTYATTTMGADHTAGYTIAPEILGVGGHEDPLSAAKKGELSRAFQATTAFIDTAGYCLFISFAVLDIEKGYEAMYKTVNAMYGTNWTGDDVLRVGKEVLRTERNFNEEAGFCPADDRLPEFMTYEPLLPHHTTFDVPAEVLDEVYKF